MQGLLRAVQGATSALPPPAHNYTALLLIAQHSICAMPCHLHWNTYHRMAPVSSNHAHTPCMAHSVCPLGVHKTNRAFVTSKRGTISMFPTSCMNPHPPHQPIISSCLQPHNPSHAMQSHPLRPSPASQYLIHHHVPDKMTMSPWRSDAGLPGMHESHDPAWLHSHRPSFKSSAHIPVF